MPYRSSLILSVLLLSGCTASSEQVAQPFQPGIPGRDATAYCNSKSAECKHWTELQIKCDDYVRRNHFDTILLRLFGLEKLQGDIRKLDTCEQAEQYREQVTGVTSPGDPGGYRF
jgi:hypothetical protein